MKRISLDNDPELVKRLVTGLIAQWDTLPKEIQDAILREAALAFDPASRRVQLLEELKLFIKNCQSEADH
ncbi:MAG: hypothetical protein ACR2KT_13360 [Methylocella sp.]